MAAWVQSPALQCTGEVPAVVEVTAAAQIRALARERPYATGAAVKEKKNWSVWCQVATRFREVVSAKSEQRSLALSGLVAVW